jgi:formylglycine-generating enzyme required for sulfatase activity
MATLGYTSVGASDSFGLAENFVFAAGPYTASENGTIDSVSVRTGSAVGITLGVYNDSSGTPGTLVADSAGGTSTSGGWTTQAVSGSLVSGQAYWVAWNTSVASDFKYDTPASQQIEFAASAYSAGTLPGSFPGSPTEVTNRQYSAYITYTPGGGGGPVVPVFMNQLRQQGIA